VLRRSTAIIADSHATKEDIKRFFGVRDGKIVVIYPGVDVPAQPSVGVADAARVVAGGQPFILCPGPWVRRKNIEVVMQAFALLAPRVPDIHLVVTGDRPPGMTGPRAADLLAHVPAQYHDRVHLTGYVPSDMRNALFAQAALLCYPSKYEGFGLPPLEAMSVGVPVIVASTPACVEVTGDAALVVDADDPLAWALAIESVLSRPDLAGKLRAHGLQRSAKFTWRECVRRTAHLYHRVHNV
jgi:glycosyltransferase involved in cell wall biosynthesis